jgi:hypothetical protein
MAVLLVGAILGRPVPAFVALLLLGGLDAWLRLERVGVPAGLAPRFASPLAGRLFQEDGRFVPAVRWGTLAVTAALLLALPPTSLWRF